MRIRMPNLNSSKLIIGGFPSEFLRGLLPDQDVQVPSDPS